MYLYSLICQVFFKIYLAYFFCEWRQFLVLFLYRNPSPNSNPNPNHNPYSILIHSLNLRFGLVNCKMNLTLVK